MLKKMIIPVVMILVSLFVSSPVMAKMPVPFPKVDVDVVMADHYPVQDISFPDGVRGIPALIYWQPTGYRPLKLDLYLPPVAFKRPDTGFPLVIYIHGGGWTGGDRHRSGPFVDFPGLLASLAAQGYVIASIDYRLSGEAKYPAQIQDVKAAIRWLKQNASKYDIDPQRVLTWGVSAGGHLAGLAAVSCGVAMLEPKQPGRSSATGTKADSVTSSSVSDCVQAGVAWYGVFNMATIAAQSKQSKAMSRSTPQAPEWQLLGCFDKQCARQQMTSASPVAYVDRNDPPMLLIAGEEDKTVPCQQTLEMAEQLRLAGVKHKLIVIPETGHSFIGKSPEQTRDANLKALDATIRFMDQTIGIPFAGKGEK